MKADFTGHAFIWAEVAVLIVVDPNFFAIGEARQMAADAADTRSNISLSADLRRPQLSMWRVAIGQRMRSVTFQASVDSCVLAIETMPLMTGITRQLLVSRTVMHREPRLSWCHGRHSRYQPHAVFSLQEALGGLFVTLLTGLQCHRILPDSLLFSFARNLLAVTAVDASLCMCRGGPIGKKLLIAEQ